MLFSGGAAESRGEWPLGDRDEPRGGEDFARRWRLDPLALVGVEMFTCRPGGSLMRASGIPPELGPGGAAAGSWPAALPCWGTEWPAACVAPMLEPAPVVASTSTSCARDMLYYKQTPCLGFLPALAIADHSRAKELQAVTAGSDIKLKTQNSALLLGEDGIAILLPPFPEGRI